MPRALCYRVEPGPGGSILRLEGRVDRSVARELSEILDGAQSAQGSLALDLSGVEELDSAAVAALVRGWRRSKERGGSLSVRSASEAARRSLSMFRLRDAPPAARPPAFFELSGGRALEAARAVRDLAQLAADATALLLRALARPSLLRPSAVAEQAIFIGSKALPIVALIAFLVGLTLAFQSAYQLRQFGAAIFVANLMGVAVIREMGPLMTAILVAGRSGSSIAAEVSTMKVSEEIDALTVMGVDPLAYLALPRLCAILATLPLLTVFADAFGVLGGFLVGVFYLDLAPAAFLNQMLDALAPKDVLTGVAKSLAFAWGIGLIGLFYGFRVQGGAAEVGRTTTASVVASIFFIIVADCAFSVLFYIVL
jgi:phospholipid/cholesterol/gamma-HCH transport system permease protein